MSEFKKNTAGQRVVVGLVKAADGAPLTGATVAVDLRIDGGALNGVGNATEIGKGLYEFLPSQAQTNGDVLQFVFSEGTAVSAFPIIWTTDKRTSELNDLDAAASGAATWNAQQASHVGGGTFGLAINNGGAGPWTQGNTVAPLDAAATAAAVWDALLSSHTDLTRFGGYTQNIVSDLKTHGDASWNGLDDTETAEAVWNALLASHNNANSFGRSINDGGPGPWTTGAGSDPVAIAAAVWDALLASHVDPNSFGEYVQAIVSAIIAHGGPGDWTTGGGGAAPTPDQNAEAVWNRLLSLHPTPGSAGKRLNDTAQDVIDYGGANPWTTGSGGGPSPVGDYNPTPVPEARQWNLTALRNGACACEDVLSAVADETDPFGIDFRRHLPQNSYLTKIELLESTDISDPDNPQPGNWTLEEQGVWGSLAKFRITNESAGDKEEISIRVTTREGGSRTAKVRLEVT